MKLLSIRTLATLAIFAMLAVASVDVWQWTPFVYLVLFSGLQTVPRESVEAAQIDGASGWAQFRYIDLHYLRPLFILLPKHRQPIRPIPMRRIFVAVFETRIFNKIDFGGRC